MIIGYLKNIYTKINNGILFNPNAEYPPVSKQKIFLQSFKEPKNEYDESYYKYKCVEYYHYDIKSRLVLNTLAIGALVFFLPYYVVRGAIITHRFEEYKGNNVIICKASERIPIVDIFPEKLKTEYDMFLTDNGQDYAHAHLPLSALKIFWGALIRHPFCPHYLLVLLIRLSQNSFLIYKYRPSCIVTYVCEREFADPLVTKLCERLKIKYEGFMHGDFCYSVDKAFMHFTRYWVWSLHYQKMLTSLRCKQKMDIYMPGKYMNIENANRCENECEYYLTYYCSGGVNRNSLLQIKKIFDKMRDYKKKCIIRPHPRFSDMRIISTIFLKDEIENPLEVQIEDSIRRTYYPASIISTVLSQAYYSGKKVIIDDCSNPQYFNELKEADYIMIDNAYMRLSDLLQMVFGDKYSWQEER